MSTFTDLVFWAQILGDAQRIIYCEPGRVEEVRAIVEQKGLAGTITVTGNPYCPAGKLLIVDPGALEANTQQAAQRAATSLRFGL